MKNLDLESRVERLEGALVALSDETERRMDNLSSEVAGTLKELVEKIALLSAPVLGKEQ